MQSFRSEGSKFHIEQPSLEVLHQEDEHLENLDLKASGVCFQESQRALGSRDFTLKGAHKNLTQQRPRAEAVI